MRPHVVHGDIRSSNVLLDEELGAHILGVGLGKPVAPCEGRGAMAGTYGYLAPELVYRNELTTKSDVYSFGVLLLELLSGRAPVRDSATPDWLSIFAWATPLAQSGNFEQLLDPSLAPPLPTIAEIQKVIDLVYACTQLVPSMRPRMSFAVHQLQQLQQLPAPTPLADAVLEMPPQL
jgi:serine/threonine protein kinase